MRKRAVFIDKDGTLVEDIPYNVDPGLIRFTTGAVSGLQLLKQLGYLIVIVTNQSGVARGMFTERDLMSVRDKIRQMLLIHGVTLDAFVYCPHHPDGNVKEYVVECICRKPLPGLILNVAEQLDIDLQGSWMIGDILDDVEAGNRAGCRTILIDNGNETEWLLSEHRKPTTMVQTIGEAARYIMKRNVEEHARELQQHSGEI